MSLVSDNCVQCVLCSYRVSMILQTEILLTDFLKLTINLKSFNSVLPVVSFLVRYLKTVLSEFMCMFDIQG